jgi:hypothetical protein
VDRQVSGAALDGWLPIGVDWRNGRPQIDWCLAGHESFRESFFEDTVRRLVARPFNKAFRRCTPVETLESWAEERPGLVPNGFIFHMSRCGSTLVAQMLAARSDSVVLSEPAPFDSMLHPKDSQPAIAEDDHIRWLRALVSAMDQRRTGDGRYFFVKFDCWHALSLPLIRRAFPTVPLVFLYRQPREVLASHLRQRGVQTVPGLVDSRLFGIDGAAAVTMPAPEYCARVLGAICEAAAREPGVCLVNYRQLPGVLFETILPWFGVPVTAESHAAMTHAAKLNSKNPHLPFSAEDDAKPIPADGHAERAVAAFLDEPYQRLERRAAARPRRLADAVVNDARDRQERRG